MAKYKISIVQYLNSAPLAWGLLEGDQKYEFDSVLSTPADCADQLARGVVDIGLIPSIEYQRIPGTRVVPGPVIAATHRVQSVILISLVPLWQVRTVAADRGSRTSVSLAQIIFKEFYRTTPEFRSAEPDLSSMLAQNDAALLIGDQALKFVEMNEPTNLQSQKSFLRLGSEPLQVFDLVERWKFLTGLPFVFAFWAVREGIHGKAKNIIQDREIVNALVRSRNFGLDNLATITDRYSETLGIKKGVVQEYLQRMMYYYMDPSCIDALNLFYEKARAVGAIKTVRHLEFL